MYVRSAIERTVVSKIAKKEQEYSSEQRVQKAHEYVLRLYKTCEHKQLPWSVRVSYKDNRVAEVQYNLKKEDSPNDVEQSLRRSG